MQRKTEFQMNLIQQTLGSLKDVSSNHQFLTEYLKFNPNDYKLTLPHSSTITGTAFLAKQQTYRQTILNSIVLLRHPV